MTAVSVVDASAIAAVVFGEAEGEAVQARLSGSRLIAPALLPFELASVCAKKLKHHPGQAKAILAQWRALREVPIELCGVDFDAFWQYTFRTMSLEEIARAHGISRQGMTKRIDRCRRAVRESPEANRLQEWFDRQ